MSRVPSRVPTRALAVAAVGALALTAACGGSSKPSGGGSASSAAKGTKGGTLHYLSETDFEHLDPARVYVTNASDFGRLIYRTLMTYDNGSDSTKVVPDLATAPGTPSDDAKTWTYHIKQGLKYEDGTEITTADIKYGVERTFSDQLPEGPPYYNTLLLGAADYKGPYKDTSDFKGIETPDKYTIIFHFTKPFADADYAAALTTTAPVPKAKDTGVKYDNRPFSSGPYEIKTYNRGKNIDLVRNPNWVASTDPAIGAYPNEIVGELGLDGAIIDSRLTASNGTDADGVTDKPSLEPQNVNADLNNPQVKAHLFKGPDGSTVYSSMDTVKGPFKDIKVRQAFEVAYPLAAARIAAGGPSVGDFATDALPPSLSSHDGSLDVYGQKANGFKGDEPKAKTMLAAAGYPNGVTITTDVSDTPAAIKTASAVKAGLAASGFNLKITPIDPSKYYDTIGQPAKQPDLVGYAWIPDWPSASTVIPPLFTCGAIKPQGNNNPSNYCNKSFDAMSDAAQAETDATKRDAIWTALDKQLLTDAVIVPRYFGITTWLYGTSVTGVRSALPFGGEIDLANVSLKS